MPPAEAWLKPGWRAWTPRPSGPRAARPSLPRPGIEDLPFARPAQAAEDRERNESPRRRRWTPEELRAIRACEVLEAIGTADARTILSAWAQGAPDTTLAREATTSIRRLTRQRDR